MRRLALSAIALGLALGCASAPLPPPPGKARIADWVDEPVVTIVTRDAGGKEHATPVWIVEAEGEAWLIGGGSFLTGASRWAERVRSQPEVELRAGEYVYPARAEVVDDPARMAAARAAMREKYGWQDRVAWLTTARKKVLVRVRPR